MGLWADGHLPTPYQCHRVYLIAEDFNVNARFGVGELELTVFALTGAAQPLPVLPHGLNSFICWDMGVEILPRLPATLQVVSCAWNNNYNEEFWAIEAMRERLEVVDEDEYIWLSSEQIAAMREPLGDDDDHLLNAEQIAAVNAYHDRAEARACGRDILGLTATVARRPDVSDELSAHMGSFLSGVLTTVEVQRATLQLQAQ